MNQYLASQGYVVLSTNYRLGIMYGRAFRKADNASWRGAAEYKDVLAGAMFLQTLATVDPKKIGLWGGSYGGYMVLAGLAFQPQLWAAGVDIVGISSLATFLENTSPWRRAFREREYGSLEHDYDFLVEASPLSRVDGSRWGVRRK